MPSLSGLLLFIPDWLTNHGLPTLAGFVAGIIGADLRLRWDRRKRPRGR